MQKILQTVNLLPIFYTDTPSRCAENILSKHCLCHDTGEIPHTFLSSVRVNFHREVSLTLFYFFFDFPVEYLNLSFLFCYNLLWVTAPKTEQNLKRTVVKIEHFTAVFLYPKERKEVAEMANRNLTNPVQFYLSDDEQYILNTKLKASGMKSMSAFLRKQILYGYVYDVDVDKLRAEYQSLETQKKELTATYKNCEKEVWALNRKLENLNQYLGRTQTNPVQEQFKKKNNPIL